MILLTQEEVAKLLGCSTSKIKRLRVERRLTYVPGRPVLIDEADLNAYIAAKEEADRRNKALYDPDPGTPEWKAKKLSEFKLQIRLHWLDRRIAAMRDKLD